MASSSAVILFPFQRECVNEVGWFNGRSLLAAEPGLGKTYMALEHVRREGLTPAVVVCPASVKYFWERVAGEFGLRTHVVEGRGDAGSAPLTVVNWDVLRNHASRLQRSRPACVVADECHAAANGMAKRTLALRRLCRDVPSVLALSGTPMVNRPIELWPILSLLRPDVFDSRLEYLRRFCGPRWTPWGWDFRGSSNLDELHRLLDQTVMVRRRKTDVLADLPPKFRDVVPLPLSDRAEYEAAEGDFLGWLRKTDPSRVRRAARAEAVVKVGYLLRLAARLKLPAVVEWAEDWLAGCDGKLVVFARHRAVLDGLEAGLGRFGSVRVDGSTVGRGRQRRVDAFQADPGVRLLLGNVRAAGTGLTLTAASTVAFAELGWTPGEHVQAEDRCHRIGTTEPVWAHYLVARGTVEERLAGIIQGKARDLSTVLDGGPQDEDLDVLDQLLGSFGRT